MKAKSIFLGMLGCLFVAVGWCAESSPGGLKGFQQQCLVAFDEPWRTIPWKISLLEAQKLAAEEKKPIYIWAMDGHPLGCT
jgi:hypothetical protein